MLSKTDGIKHHTEKITKHEGDNRTECGNVSFFFTGGAGIAEGKDTGHE